MADENKGIVMGTAGLKPTALFAATREVFRGASAPARQNANTGVACWKCKEDGVVGNPVVSTGEGLRCNMGHKYTDTIELLVHPHDTVPVPQREVVQGNYVSFTVPIPGSVLQAMQAKYPDPNKLKSTFAALAQRMIEGVTLIVPEAEVRRLSDACGIPIKAPADLFGVVKGQKQQIDDLEEELKAHGPVASGGGTALRRGELILWFDPPTTQSLIEKAKAAERRLEEFLEQFIGQANENSWF